MKVLEMENRKMKKKRISVSQKRQITIPLEYYKALNIGEEVECFMSNKCIVIKPIMQFDNEEFSECILKDLIEEGYEGEQLLIEFRKRKGQIRPAIEKMLEEADRVAENSEEYTVLEDLFDEEE